MELHPCLYCDLPTRNERCQTCIRAVDCICCLEEIRYRPKRIYGGQYCIPCAEQVSRILGDVKISHNHYLRVVYKRDDALFTRDYPLIEDSNECPELTPYQLPGAEIHSTETMQVEHI